MVNMGGKDCTDAFANYHPFSVYRKILPSFYIGDVVDTLDNDQFTKEHRAIRQELLRRGLFETNNMYVAKPGERASENEEAWRGEERSAARTPAGATTLAFEHPAGGSTRKRYGRLNFGFCCVDFWATPE